MSPSPSSEGNPVHDPQVDRELNNFYPLPSLQGRTAVRPYPCAIA